MTDKTDLIEQANEKYLALYEATNKLMARLGAEGEYHPDMDEVSDVMNALHDIDGGVYNPPIDNKDDLMTAIRAKEDAEERLRVVDAVYMMAAEALPHDMRTLFNNEAIKNAKGKEHILNMSSDAFIEQACEVADKAIQNTDINWYDYEDRQPTKDIFRNSVKKAFRESL